MFKMPDDEREEDASTVPLLTTNERQVSIQEQDELFAAEGPNSALRGTLMDGIANVLRYDFPGNHKHN